MTPAQDKQIETAYLRFKATETDLRKTGTPEAAIRASVARRAEELGITGSYPHWEDG